MTRLQLKQKIRNRLSEDNTRQIAESFWLDADLDEYIDEILKKAGLDDNARDDAYQSISDYSSALSLLSKKVEWKDKIYKVDVGDGG